MYRKLSSKPVSLFLVIAMLVVLVAGCSSTPKPEEKPLVLAHQQWTEHYILGDIFKILLEEKGKIALKEVEIGTFALTWDAMKAGQVDITPEYTSDGYTVALGDTGLRDPDEVYNYVKTESEKQGLTWLDRLGFYCNYDLAVRPEVAQQYNLKTYSDLAKVSNKLVIAADVNFNDRPDCYPMLKDKYGMNFKDVKLLDVALKYKAIDAKEAQVVNNYTTDAEVAQYGLVVLADDKHAYPPFEAAPLVRLDALQRFPQIKEVMGSLAGKISNAEMAQMNYRFAVKGEDSAVIAREFLESKGLIDKK